MKKYKVILGVLIISIISVTGFVVYKNYIKPWKEAEIYINKYMVKQDISKDNIKSITREKAKKASYKGILYRVYYKDDPQYEYQYFYSDDYYALYVNKVMLQIYDMENNNKLLKSNEELKGVKYPPIYLKGMLDK
ncbi:MULTISPECIES: DUF3139 domain-containing protein [unclassified Clostridioides]|uniref:DUF3139 domain-containing protein n=1 Tax=unclassified Clostridioides TaxID=2635829 RepID=UPI001D114B6F|nr:DUF3139 domain-containing protein [Clostridioides sp. ES-S-0001-02]MCC0673721.1 DUF3139 domain-containing protein [Clostridioides sp. ES-S-0145-01]MCC0680781.1 DUF3139 domain-containing protein [Clostridioides sp. ES-S-0005-03]MCC0694614.1 DUF3139 domain-containing protein [Clostridioides sp. ES-S-0048-02]UDN46990.1 DUF3139 domain-containing protein [Clostridioides sp. ES-S-0173-01]